MHAHVIHPTQTRSHPAAPAVAGTVTPVGTFACGQSAQGSFEVSARAGLGSFASGVAVERPPERA